jgi:hypothetical protein
VNTARFHEQQQHHCVHVVCVFLMTRVIFSHRMGSTLAQAAGQALLLHLCGAQK